MNPAIIDSRLGMQDARALAEPAYWCNRCREHIAGERFAEDHLVYMHGVARDIAREAIVVGARG